WWEREYKHLESSKYTDAVPHIKYGFWMAYQAGGAELVEALEKAQTQSSKWLEAYHKAVSIGARYEERIAELESRTVTPVTYSESADADHCRKWAWEQVKGEVSTEEWTTGDNITYFGFFCWGWDMRRQYNEQRPVTVNLPRPGFITISGERTAVYLKDDVDAVLAAAGIREAE
ncbi:hypothetical protein, partial [Klebsiella pneumoniae]|uniref:hypothetical protein n=1 Tax=Klebsiella pneumoniae TaxID=573 RepID=UPI001D0EABBA